MTASKFPATAAAVAALTALLTTTSPGQAQSPEPTAAVEIPAGRWVVWAGASSFAPAAPAATSAPVLSGEFAAPAAPSLTSRPAAVAPRTPASGGEFDPATARAGTDPSPSPSRPNEPSAEGDGVAPFPPELPKSAAPSSRPAPRSNAPELYRLRDRQLNEVYQTLSRRLTPADRERLKQNEREWIRGMEGLPTLEQKIRAIESRTLELQRMIVR